MMDEHNIVIKKEVEDPSYCDTYVNNSVPNTTTSYEVSTGFFNVKVEDEVSFSPLVSQIKVEPLDLTPDRAPERAPDSPQLPDSTTGTTDPPADVKVEDYHSNVVEVTLDHCQSNEVGVTLEHCQNNEVAVSSDHCRINEVKVTSELCQSNEVVVSLEPIPYDKNDHEEKVQEQKEIGLSKSIIDILDEKKRRNECKKKFVIKDGKFSCLICNRIYMTKASIVRHLLNHTEKDFAHPPDPSDIIKCDKCGKTFKNASNLLQHSYIHLDTKLFQCDQCDRSFTLKSNLIRHQGKSQCKLPDTKIVCDICNKFFAKDSQLRSHLKKHSVERPFACDDCGMNFKYKSTLVRHLQHHNGVKPYSCNICNKTFTHFGLIKPHMRMHTGEKPYTCPICSKKFSHKHNMLRHQVRHDKVVNLNCPVCDKRFPKESRLKYHMRTHMDEKFFACGICPKKFSHRQNVIRHYSRKHPDSIYQSTDTDASVALKLWNEVKSNKRPLPAFDTNKRKVVKKKLSDEDKVDEKDTNCDVDFNNEEEEEILPDIKEKPQVSFEVVNIKVECDTESE